MTATATAAGNPPIVLEIAICDQRRSYRVVFEGPQAEQRALAFAQARRSTHATHEIESEPIAEQYGQLIDYLYPTCEHGLSAWLCAGPQHYPTDAQLYGYGW